MQIDAPSFGVGVRPAALNIIYPVGSGPSTPTGTGHVYHLLAKQGQDLGPNRTASNYAPSVIAKHPDAKGVRKDELEAAQQRLLDANRIHIVTVGPESKRRKYVASGPAPAADGEPG